MLRLHKQTFWEGVFFFLLGFAILVLIPSQVRISPTVQTTVTPKFVPTLIGISLIIVGFFMVLQAYKRRGEESSLSVSSDGFFRVLLSILLLVSYIELFSIVGIVVSSGIFIALYSYMFGLRDYLKMAAVSVLVPVVIWLVFEYVFRIPMPHGLLF